MKTTFAVLRDLLVKDYELARERLAPETALADIDLDSLALTELIFSLEDEFHVIATTSGTAGFTTLGDVATYIDQLVAERDAAQRSAGP
jgi:acyl carrier protein